MAAASAPVRQKSTCAIWVAKRTLVLVDGLRFVNGSSASGIPSTVDLNTIPANMIERIEVLQSGQSPLYGSDAISGVVNIITKQQQDGLQVSGQFGTYRQGDGHTQDYNATYGINGPTTHIVVGASYVKQDAVRTADRARVAIPQPRPDELRRPDRRVQQRNAERPVYRAGPAQPDAEGAGCRPAAFRPAEPDRSEQRFQGVYRSGCVQLCAAQLFPDAFGALWWLRQRQAGAERQYQFPRQGAV